MITRRFPRASRTGAISKQGFNSLVKHFEAVQNLVGDGKYISVIQDSNKYAIRFNHIPTLAWGEVSVASVPFGKGKFKQAFYDLVQQKRVVYPGEVEEEYLDYFGDDLAVGTRILLARTGLSDPWSPIAAECPET